MAGRADPHIPGRVYFVVLYANGQQPIFAPGADQEAFSQLVARITGKCNAIVHAYCWQSDAVRLVLQVHNVSLPGVIRRIAAQHARAVNRKLRRKGFLFQHPHRSAPLDDRGAILEAVRHVHLSAVEKTPGSPLALYPWCSHRVYLGVENVQWLTTQSVLALLAGDRITPPIAYERFMAATQACRRAMQTRLRSRPTSPHRADEAFFGWLKARSAGWKKPASLEQLIVAVAEQIRVDPAAISSRDRSPSLSLARGLVAWYAVQNDIAPAAEVARRFGRGRSTLHEMREAYRVRVPKLFNIPLEEILNRPGVAASEVPDLFEQGRAHASRKRK